MNKKICTRCGRLLPATSEYFGIEKRVKNGLRAECYKCHVNIDREYRKQNPTLIARAKKIWRDRHPERIKTWRHFNQRMIGYIIPRRKPCCICGRENANGHHEDYDNQYIVSWLCDRCHARYHAGLIPFSKLIFSDYTRWKEALEAF